MSVATEADERLDSASKHIAAAARDMAAIVIDGCWGYDGFSDEYTVRLRVVLTALLNLKNTLGR